MIAVGLFLFVFGWVIIRLAPIDKLELISRGLGKDPNPTWTELVGLLILFIGAISGLAGIVVWAWRNLP